MHRPTRSLATARSAERLLMRASAQGLTLVHFSAQRKRFLLDRGGSGGVQGVLGGIRGV